MNRNDLVLGIYEKALPLASNWTEKCMQAAALGFHFIEMSIDESDMRLERLDWTDEEKRDFREAQHASKIRVPSLCLSGHRRFPLGSHDPSLRKKAHEIMQKAIHLADALGIRVIQLAGYDVYYEESDEETQSFFLEGLQSSIAYAARFQVMLAMEIMDRPLMGSILKFLRYKKLIPSPWFCLYPDLGNLSAWGCDLQEELSAGSPYIVGVHLKDTLKVTAEFPGQFRDLSFGEGSVDFQKGFRALKELCYCGPFLIEMWTEHAERPLEEIGKARKWILSQMDAAAFFDGV